MDYLTFKIKNMLDNFYKIVAASIMMILSIFGSINAQSADDAYRTEVFSTSGSPAVDISTSGGFVHVFGHDDNEVRIEMYVRRGRQYLSPSNTDLSDYEISISHQDDEVTAYAKKEKGNWLGLLSSNNNVSVSFRVYVPHASVVDGRTSGGSVSGENLTNHLSLRTSGGSVTARHVEGQADLRTSGGSVTLEDVHGNIDAKTSGGSIQAENVSGIANLKTSGGSIRLQDVSAKLSAHTSGGGIRSSFSTFDNDIDLKTSGGSIRIDLPSTSNFNVDLSGQRVVTELKNFTGESGKRSVRGQMGEGGPLIKAKTSGGSVRLVYH